MTEMSTDEEWAKTVAKIEARRKKLAELLIEVEDVLANTTEVEPLQVIE